MSHSKTPTVYTVDAEIICIDQGQDRITLILSGRKQGLDEILGGGGGAAEPADTLESVKDKIERMQIVEQRKQDIVETIQKLQQIYLTLSE
jgi:hypothetical protein